MRKKTLTWGKNTTTIISTVYTSTVTVVDKKGRFPIFSFGEDFWFLFGESFWFYWTNIIILSKKPILRDQWEILRWQMDVLLWILTSWLALAIPGRNCQTSNRVYEVQSSDVPSFVRGLLYITLKGLGNDGSNPPGVYCLYVGVHPATLESMPIEDGQNSGVNWVHNFVDWRPHSRAAQRRQGALPGQLGWRTDMLHTARGRSRASWQRHRSPWPTSWTCPVWASW